MNLLIEKLEKATGPDRELDAAIAVELFPIKYVVAIKNFRIGLVGIRNDEVQNGYGYISECDAPNFTSSIDAALTLVRDGAEWEIHFWPEGANIGGAIYRVLVWLNRDTDTRLGQHKSAAIALCIAALKARAALGEKIDG